MFTSKCLVSNKGPLGAIWVAAYFFKKLKKAQIFETNISSSVDNILQDLLEILAYRVLAYLLLGVVRVYSKKVEYLFDDCQEVLIKLNEFVVREKNRAKKEALRATCFCITRPVSFDLDAFDLEILEDTSGDNVVPHEEITLKDVDWKNTEIRQYSLDRFAALDDDFLMDYTPTTEYARKPKFRLSCHLMDYETEASTSHDACDLEASMEKLRYDKSFHEEVSHLKIFSGFEEEPRNLVEVFDKNKREHVELPDMAVLENTDREANREKYNDTFLAEKRLNLRSEAEEDPLGPLKSLVKDQTNRKMMKGPDLSASESEMHQALEEDHVNILEASAEFPDIAGLENYMEREAMREECNYRFSSEEGVNLPRVAEEEPLRPVDSVAEEEPLRPVETLGDDQNSREKMKGPGLLQSENDLHQVMEEDHISILEASTEVLDVARSNIGREASRGDYNDKFFQEEYLNLIAVVEEKYPGLIKPFSEERTNREKMKGLDRVQLENEVHLVIEEGCNLEASVEKLEAEGFSGMVLEELSPLVRPLHEEIQTSSELVNFPAITTSSGGNCQVAAKDHLLSVTLDASPQSMLEDVAGATTPRFMLIPTPAIKECARFSRKRKYFLDDMIVFPNGIIRQWIKDASDLVSKRGKGGHSALGARKTRWISNLPQSFSEPSVPCTSELKSLYCGKRLKLLESIKIMKNPAKIDRVEPPAVGGSLEQAEIAPDTVEIRDPLDKLNLSECPRFDGSLEQAGIAPQTPVQQSPSFVEEQTEIAPQTPVLHSKSVRPFESPENLKCDKLDEVGPTNVDHCQNTEKEPSLNEIVENEPSLRKDEDLDLNLGSKETQLSNDDNQGQYGWSTRTMLVAKNLQRSFLDQKKRGEEEKVKLSQLLKGRTKKASARLFYEILVLKTKGLVDVKQDAAFDDIFVLKAPQWDQTYITDGK